MSWLRTIARTIRHLPFLENADDLWRLLRRPYLALINFSGQGVTVCVGGSCPVRMPPEYVGSDWEKYEPATFKILSEWLSAHPDGLVLDIGSSVGVFTLAALECSPGASVVAFDSDLPSLQAVRQMTRFTNCNGRLRAIYGFVSAEHQSGLRLDAAATVAERMLREAELSGEPGTTRYVCLHKSDGLSASIPVNSLDGLFAVESESCQPVLIKCDVEGAELLVLRGAQSFLAARSPAVLLSVHPGVLPEFGHSPDDIRRLLAVHGYSVSLVAEDHEEHWWCVKSSEGAR